MIEDVIEVYYGERDASARDLKKTEIMPPEIPKQGDVVSVDGKGYTVQERNFNADTGGIYVLALRRKNETDIGKNRP